MGIIALPNKAEYKAGKNKNEGSIIIQPCFPGYGVTMGNSLRRVLYSSLSGAAPIRIKIEGVNHEFMTLPHLKEDILQFILNMKKLRLKVFSDEPVRLELKVHGEKVIKAEDFKKNPEVEIANQDLVLGHITDMAGSISFELMVGKGMGYEMIENREEKTSEVGWIEMDSIFSPILSVGIKVDSVRVGKMTNWDKLVVDIKTDGTVSPENAFKQSVKILIEQFKSLTAKKAVKEEIKADKEDEEDKNTKDKEKDEQAKEEKKADVETSQGASDETEKDEKIKKKRGRPKKL